MEPWREELYHSSGPWKKHKYLKKIGNTYIYAKKSRELEKNAKNLAQEYDKEKAIADEAGKQFRRNPFADNSDVVYDKWRYNLHSSVSKKKLSRMVYKGSERYEKLAKEELKSIPKEIVSDGKRLVSAAITSIQNNRTGKQARSNIKKTVSKNISAITSRVNQIKNKKTKAVKNKGASWETKDKRRALRFHNSNKNKLHASYSGG